MIDWQKIENYLVGTHDFGKAWIRLDREGKSTALYLQLGELEKFPVEDGDETKPETLKIKAELILNQYRLANLQKLSN